MLTFFPFHMDIPDVDSQRFKITAYHRKFMSILTSSVCYTNRELRHPFILIIVMPHLLNPLEVLLKLGVRILSINLCKVDILFFRFSLYFRVFVNIAQFRKCVLVKSGVLRAVTVLSHIIFHFCEIIDESFFSVLRDLELSGEEASVRTDLYSLHSNFSVEEVVEIASGRFYAVP